LTGKWSRYWSLRSNEIATAVSTWRNDGEATLKLSPLSEISDRRDLYDWLAVTFNMPSNRVSGNRHLLELERVIAPLLQPGESVRVSIEQRGQHDYLVFS
jgi:hypothetical protein